jgi:osomolarity two-component system sensor histidine kinase TcsA
MLDTRGHIATWNSGAAILKGYTATEIVGQHFSVFYGRKDCETSKATHVLEVCLRETEKSKMKAGASERMAPDSGPMS